jgi:hypothetical protein
MADQNYNVYLNFKDDASGKFIKATDEMIASMKKLGITVKKEGNSVAVDMDKSGQQTQKFGRNLRGAGTEANEFRLAMGSLRNQILVYMFALRPVIEFTQKAIKESNEYERVTTKLTMAFANTRKGNSDSVVALKAYADQLQATTGYAEHEVLSSAAMLATMRLTDTQINQLLPSILDLNTALRLGGDENSTLTETAKVVGRAFQGNTMTLERMGIKLDQSTKKSKDFDSILKAIKQSTTGMAAAMGGTFEGQMKIMGAAWNDFSRSVGDAIIKSPALIAYIRMLTGEIKTLTTNLNETRDSTNNFKNAWIGTITGLSTVGRILQASFRGIFMIIQTDLLMVYKLGEGLSWLIVQWKQYRIAEMKQNSPWESNIIDKLEKEKVAAQEWKDMFNGASSLMIKDMKEVADKTDNTINQMIDDYSNLINATTKVEQDQYEFAKTLDKIRIIQQEGAASTYDGMYEIASKAVTGIRDLFTDTLVDGVKTGFKNMSDIVVSFGDLMLKTIMQVIVMQTMLRSFGPGLYSGFLGFAGGVGAHTGGYITESNSSYGYSPRKEYHSGGEVNVTLLEGEGVLNKKAMRNLGVNNLDKINRGEKLDKSTSYTKQLDFIDKPRKKYHYGGEISSSLIKNEELLNKKIINNLSVNNTNKTKNTESTKELFNNKIINNLGVNNTNKTNRIEKYNIKTNYDYNPRKKYHSGGEVNATLLEGEGVLNKNAMRSLGVNNLDKLNRGEKMGGSQTVNNYYINAIDTKSFRDMLSENGDIYIASAGQGIRDNTGLRKISQRLG